ncbi:MAG: Maf family protein [Bryobacteraceae bacterium]
MRNVLILASRSPRRAEILTQAGIPFEQRTAGEADEAPRPGERPSNYVQRLAADKARLVEPGPNEIVLGADTTVAIEDQILGKPANAEDARRMLRLLSGRTHEVLTGVALRSREQMVTDVASTKVWFLELTEEEIDAYVAGGEPLDKAGAYGIQGLAAKFIPRIEGCYFNVVGLPVAVVYRRLREMKRSPP